MKFIFLIKLFCYIIKKSRQNSKYLENEQSFWVEIKSIFHNFKRAFNCQKLSQAWECAFKKKIWYFYQGVPWNRGLFSGFSMFFQVCINPDAETKWVKVPKTNFLVTHKDNYTRWQANPMLNLHPIWSP